MAANLTLCRRELYATSGKGGWPPRSLKDSRQSTRKITRERAFVAVVAVNYPSMTAINTVRATLIAVNAVC